MFQIRQAERQKLKCRLLIAGVTGSGKTLSALRIAKGIKEGIISDNPEQKVKIAVADSENASSERYAPKVKGAINDPVAEHDFDIIDMPSTSIDTYTELFAYAEKQSIDILIIDSISHAWQALIDEVQQIAKAKFNGNTYTAWSVGTPKQKKFIKALLNYSGHVIATVRSKMAYELQENDRGRKVPVKLGLAPEQGKEIEYEFDLVLEINADHTGTFTKSRLFELAGTDHVKPNEKIGMQLYEWFEAGIDLNEQVKEAITALDECTELDHLTDLYNEFIRIQTKEEWLKALGNRKKEIREAKKGGSTDGTN